MKIVTPKGRIGDFYGPLGPRYLIMNGVPIHIHHYFGEFDLTKHDYAHWHFWAPWNVVEKLVDFMSDEGRRFVKPEYEAQGVWDPHDRLVFVQRGEAQKFVVPGEAIIEEKWPEFLDEVGDLVEEYITTKWYPHQSCVDIGGVPVYIGHLFSAYDFGDDDYYSYLTAPLVVIVKIINFLESEGRAFVKPAYEARCVYEPRFHIAFREMGRAPAFAEAKQAIIEEKWPEFLDKVAELIGEEARKIVGSP